MQAGWDVYLPAKVVSNYLLSVQNIYHLH